MLSMNKVLTKTLTGRAHAGAHARTQLNVLIACEDGQGKFVTKVDNTTKYAHWNKNEKPMAFSKQYAYQNLHH